MLLLIHDRLNLLDRNSKYNISKYPPLIVFFHCIGSPTPLPLVFLRGSSLWLKWTVLSKFFFLHTVWNIWIDSCTFSQSTLLDKYNL